ncbi:MAG: hypothetical protein LQ351_002465 [Letrouitia transgressa]|nr:MAG: hypothetical protein LQ351_002465 [Letrouitia transgressa]
MGTCGALFASKESIFDEYMIQSATDNNTINIQAPLAPLYRAIRSALTASSVSIRLTKKDNVPFLSLTILTSTVTSLRPFHATDNIPLPSESGEQDSFDVPNQPDIIPRDRETTITQSIPVIVLSAASVANIHEPTCREPDVHIILPPLLQLKSISERFTKLALPASKSRSGGAATNSNVSEFSQSRLMLSANPYGVLKVGVETSMLKIESRWDGLTNPELDPKQVEGGEEGVREHASTKMREKEGEQAWATVRVEGRDWGRVLGVGRLGGRVIACFCHEHALILYVYLTNDDTGLDDSVLTYYIASYSQ